jgi:uncharacterized protein YjbI with pentapeptide repeats
MPKPLTAIQVPGLKFKNKEFVVSGNFHWRWDEKIAAVITREGGRLADKATETTDYFVSGHYKKAKKTLDEIARLTKKGAKLRVIDEDEFLNFVLPDQNSYVDILKSGDAERFQLFAELIPEWQAEIPLAVSNNFNSCDLSDGVYDRYNFSRIQFSDCSLKRVTIRNCIVGNLDDSDCSAAVFDAFTLHNSQRSKFNNSTFMSGYMTSTLVGCDFSQSNFTSIHFENATFTDCKFVGANCLQSRILNSSFENCDFSSTTFNELGAYGALFSKCKFSNASLRGSWLVRCRFVDCDFTECDLTNANLALSSLNSTIFERVNLSGCNLAGAEFEAVSLKTALGLDESADPPGNVPDHTLSADVLEMIDAARSAKSFEISATLIGPDLTKVVFRLYRQNYSRLAVTFEDAFVSTFEELKLRHGMSRCWFGVSNFSDYDEAINYISNTFNRYSLQIDSIAAKVSQAKVDSAKFRILAIIAWCKVFDVEPPSEKEIKGFSKKKSGEAAERELLVSLIRGGPSGIASFNEFRLRGGTPLPLKNADLSNCDLTSADLSSAELSNASFENSILQNCLLSCACLESANFKNARLDGADCSGILAKDANFSNASIGGASLKEADLTAAIARNANFSGSDFTGAELKNADFSEADLTNVTFADTRYNAKTILASEFLGAPGLLWTDYGNDPGKLRAIMEDVPTTPLDFKSFVERLEVSIDVERLKKAIKMLQAERFQLFAEVKPDSMLGVVKSQNDPELVYSCHLTSEGKFCCGTQNLNSCGGLRGALCKHLLVLLLGLTQAGELDATVADTWARASKLQTPKMDKDILSETFLRYKGAESGELDWRPTETIPEDYYSF